MQRSDNESTLLIGMVYTKSSLLNSKLQLTRDGIRCRVLKHTEHVTVYTIDIGHKVDQAEDGNRWRLEIVEQIRRAATITGN